MSRKTAKRQSHYAELRFWRQMRQSGQLIEVRIPWKAGTMNVAFVEEQSKELK